ncbi:unnamed protein product [Vitrella brassicaformis CCMP3155]|uniref:Uncharacterized protein n=1 Tax=Vitrella brassicaformis (strain CCMP3155) TaxID=1169540 RepID=A0A0G4GPV6_VITBC|nr:unnamed protein product [Vitrella brassicaformis CCMP3155]|eukprot:CEM32392.1 unnamed protein product [Vitrella brassicaformis CCMP3155]
MEAHVDASFLITITNHQPTGDQDVVIPPFDDVPPSSHSLLMMPVLSFVMGLVSSFRPSSSFSPHFPAKERAVLPLTAIKQHQFRVQNLVVQHATSSTDVDEEALEIPPFSLLGYQHKIYKTFGDPAGCDGQIEYAVEAGYVPVIPPGLAAPTATQR